ncbi:MAG: bifunctional 2-keto-4-hydroxyglutarate aldolase/2-keto-3-deoxy-6-phosphogluconate aldolase [Christensenellales bacterium]|jgi:2-dehydro-3-deoxyphosphogluconate aldolase/(4S)-4-hydroxy-2-oxoglutarate aldolase
MTNKSAIINRICEVGLVAVVRADSGEQARKIAQACIDGGIAAIELTFTVDRAHEIIADLSKSVDPDKIIIGAGTVLDAETARMAILSGARYVVSPSFNADTMRLCNRYQVPCMPGAMTVKEALEGMEAGAEITKIFPGELFGPQIIKSFRGPLPQINAMPTGGVTADNVGQWIAAGAVACGAGSSLTGGAKTGDYDAIVRTAQAFLENIKKARG